MYVQEGQLGHSCQLPDDPNGLSQDVTYRIEAGDCTSATYSVQVVVAPTIHVKKIEYKYPKYTRLEARTAEGIGDIKAIEGTQVVIHAEASHDIGSAYVHLEGVRNQTVPMKVSGRAARCKLILRQEYRQRIAADMGQLSPRDDDAGRPEQRESHRPSH